MKAASEGPDSWPHLDAGPLENGDSAHLTEVERRQRELQSKQQQLLREQRSADQERLLACITGTSALLCVPKMKYAAQTSLNNPPALQHRSPYNCASVTRSGT